MVRYKKWTFLLGAYTVLPKQEKAKYNTDALCRGVGNILFLLGASLMIGLLGEVMRIQTLMIVSGVLFTLLLIGSLIYLGDGSRFKKV